MSDVWAELNDTILGILENVESLKAAVRELYDLFKVAMSRYAAAVPPEKQKKLPLDEKLLDSLPWTENKSGTGWWTPRENCPELWEAILATEKWRLRIGSYEYVVYNKERSFINKFPVRK